MCSPSKISKIPKVPARKRQVVERERVEPAVAIPLAPADLGMKMCRSHGYTQCLLLAMLAGGWGPAFPEKRDVGEKYFNYPVLVLFHGVIEMVMGARMSCEMPFGSALDGSMRAPCGTSFKSMLDGARTLCEF